MGRRRLHAGRLRSRLQRPGLPTTGRLRLQTLPALRQQDGLHNRVRCQGSEKDRLGGEVRAVLPAAAATLRRLWLRRFGLPRAMRESIARLLLVRRRQVRPMRSVRRRKRPEDRPAEVRLVANQEDLGEEGSNLQGAHLQVRGGVPLLRS